MVCSRIQPRQFLGEKRIAGELVGQAGQQRVGARRIVIAHRSDSQQHARERRQVAALKLADVRVVHPRPEHLVDALVQRQLVGVQSNRSEDPVLGEQVIADRDLREQVLLEQFLLLSEPGEEEEELLKNNIHPSSVSSRLVSLLQKEFLENLFEDIFPRAL